MRTRQEPDPFVGVLLSDKEANQLMAVLADVLDGHAHEVRDAIGAAWSLLGRRAHQHPRTMPRWIQAKAWLCVRRHQS